jgi:hypothetical protein
VLRTNYQEFAGPFSRPGSPRAETSGPDGTTARGTVRPRSGTSAQAEIAEIKGSGRTK